MRNNKWRNISTHARVNFSQSKMSSLLRGGKLNFELLLWGGGGINRKDPCIACTFKMNNSRLSFKTLENPRCQIGKLNFQSVREILEIPSRFFRLRSHYHGEWIKKASGCSGRFDQLTRFLHSTRSSWRHNRNTITEFNSIFIGSLFLLAGFALSVQWSQKSFHSFEKPRRGSPSPFYSSDLN